MKPELVRDLELVMVELRELESVPPYQRTDITSAITRAQVLCAQANLELAKAHREMIPVLKRMTEALEGE